jgi:hypothetical protein
MPFIPMAIFSQHTVHVGASNSPDVAFFLQCFYSIFTTGNFFTDSPFARFLRALASASYSLIRLAIS